MVLSFVNKEIKLFIPSCGYNDAKQFHSSKCK